MNEACKEIPVKTINEWFERLDAIIRIEVEYDASQLKMANDAISRMKEDAIELIGQVNQYTDFNT